MNILRKILDVRSLRRQIAAFEAARRSNEERVRALEGVNASLQDRLKNLVFRYKDVESEHAAMNFRLFQLTQENKILTMKLTGTAAERDAMRKWVEKSRRRGHADE